MLAQQLDAAQLPTRISSWQAPLWQQDSFKPNFKDWKTARGQALPPLPAPEKVPPLPEGFEPGTLPGLSTLQQLLEDALAAGPAEAVAAAAAAAAANGKASRGSSSGGSSGRSSPTFGGRTAAQAAAVAAQLWGRDRAAARELVLEHMLQEPGTAVHAADAAKIAELLLPSELHTVNSISSSSGVHSDVLSGSRELYPEDILDAYLAADTTASPDARLAFLRSSVSQLEFPAAPGASFPALLGPLLGLGVLSSRQVYAKTLAAETARWGGRLPLFGPATVTAKAALAAMELNDFHRQLAGHIPQVCRHLLLLCPAVFCRTVQCADLFLLAAGGTLPSGIGCISAALSLAVLCAWLTLVLGSRSVILHTSFMYVALLAMFQTLLGCYCALGRA
jgi:hypothetical protein